MALSTAATSSNAPSDTHDDMHDKPFRFFDLPRELRNKIYSDLLLASVQTSVGPYYNPTKFKLAPFRLPAPSLVNRQFSREYSEEAFREGEMRIFVNLDADMDLCSNLPRSLTLLSSRLQRLVVQFSISADTVQAKGLFLASDFTHNQVAHFVATLPALRTLKLEFYHSHTSLRHDRLYRRQDIEDVVRSLSIAVPQILKAECLPPPMVGSTAIKVEKVLLLKSELYSTNEAAFDDGDPWLESAVETDPTNHITYRVTPSSGPGAWYGLELATESAGVFDYEWMVEKYRREQDADELEAAEDELADDLAEELEDLQWDDEYEDYGFDQEAWD